MSLLFPLTQHALFSAGTLKKKLADKSIWQWIGRKIFRPLCLASILSLIWYHFCLGKFLGVLLHKEEKQILVAQTFKNLASQNKPKFSFSAISVGSYIYGIEGNLFVLDFTSGFSPLFTKFCFKIVIAISGLLNMISSSTS